MLNEQIKQKLLSILTNSQYLDSPNDLYSYSFDATPVVQAMPDAVVFPETAEEVAEILQLADQHEIPIITRGSGTNLAGGTIPISGGIVLNTTRLNHIIEIDEQNLIATIQPGVITADLHKAVEAVGLFYPPDPGSMRISTVGGNLAQCAGGMRGLKYGVTKDYVMGLQYVLPSGEILRCGGKNVKDVAGYDMTRLMVGSEGTLGVITEILVKLLPLPETKRTLVAYFDTLIDAARTVEQVIAAKIIPATMEFLDQSTMKVVNDFAQLNLPTQMKAMLLIEQDGSPEMVMRDIERIADIATNTGATMVQTAATEEEGNQLLSARRAALSALSRLRPTTILEDATVPRSELASMIEAIERIAAKHEVMICTFGHAGDGNLHPTCMTDERDAAEMERVERAFDEIFETAIRLGGTITGEHGVGIAKMNHLELKVGRGSLELMKRIKQAFDPNNVMNPGKMFPATERRRLVVKR